jgi:hypothetical protein
MKTSTTMPQTTTEHAHHWVIGEPNGPFSAGFCKRCGVKRDFRNWLAELEFITTDDERRAA